jgi:hypothetical protein
MFFSSCLTEIEIQWTILFFLIFSSRNLFIFVIFLIRYFLYLHFKCYPESSLYPPPHPAAIPTHNQPPNPDTIAYASKSLLKGPWYSFLEWGYASALQIQKWMLTVIYRMEHRAPNGGARGSAQGAKGVCNPIGGTTMWTNQYPQSSCL